MVRFTFLNANGKIENPGHYHFAGQDVLMLYLLKGRRQP
jgi:hypothetical protein